MWSCWRAWALDSSRLVGFLANAVASVCCSFLHLLFLSVYMLEHLHQLR